jgi:hypothetical protein
LEFLEEHREQQKKTYWVHQEGPRFLSVRKKNRRKTTWERVRSSSPTTSRKKEKQVSYGGAVRGRKEITTTATATANSL